MSKPCFHCIQFIKNKFVKNIYYTDWEGKLCVEHSSTIENEHICFKSKRK